jgi:hypothetical protein
VAARCGRCWPTCCWRSAHPAVATWPSCCSARPTDPLGALRWALAELRRALGTPELFGGDPVATALGDGVEVDLDVLAGQPADPTALLELGG